MNPNRFVNSNEFEIGIIWIDSNWEFGLNHYSDLEFIPIGRLELSPIEFLFGFGKVPTRLNTDFRLNRYKSDWFGINFKPTLLPRHQTRLKFFFRLTRISCDFFGYRFPNKSDCIGKFQPEILTRERFPQSTQLWFFSRRIKVTFFASTEKFEEWIKILFQTIPVEHFSLMATSFTVVTLADGLIHFQNTIPGRSVTPSDKTSSNRNLPITKSSRIFLLLLQKKKVFFRVPSKRGEKSRSRSMYLFLDGCTKTFWQPCDLTASKIFFTLQGVVSIGEYRIQVSPYVLSRSKESRELDD